MKVFIIFLSLFIFVEKSSAQSQFPKTVREYFILLPQRYFEIELCNFDFIKNCRLEKIKYLKRYLKAEDTKKGYLEGSGDGAQEHFKMALFKRINGRPIVGLYVFGDFGLRSYFLEYKNKKWFNIAKDVVPKYKKNNIYEFSHSESKVEVATLIKTKGEIVYRELYDLVWRNGKFFIQNK